MLEDWVKELRRLAGPEVEVRLASEAAEEIKGALTATLNAGTDPEGKPWKPRKKDGGRAYANAASSLEVKASGNLVRATISGPTAYGPWGVRGAPKRPMLPDTGGGIPGSVDAALDRAASKLFEELTK
jgi:hypothetical protein